MLLEDLNRYNDRGFRPKSLRFWLLILRKAYEHPGLLAVVVYRYGGWVRRCRVPVLRQLCDLWYHVAYTWVRLNLQIEVPRDTRIGPGFRIDHFGSILVNSRAVIGRNFSVTQGVLVGGTETGVPVIGDDVHCGVGVRIIGGITLGDCLKIGTGAVVTKSFAGHAVLAGVPARMLRPLNVPPHPSGWIPPREEAVVEGR